jgi:hypothetical protein
LEITVPMTAVVIIPASFRFVLYLRRVGGEERYT